MAETPASAGVSAANVESRVRRNAALVGTVREVMVEGPSKRNPDRMSGRDGGNRIVVWDAPAGTKFEAGQKRRILVEEAHAQILVGKPVE